jgi:hypothetical protein
MKSPHAGQKDVLTTQLDDEVVVYDPTTKHAHSLNRLAVAVWNHSEGAATMDDLQKRVSNEMGTPIEQAVIAKAVGKLERAHLLVNKMVASQPLTRREALRKAGRYGAAAVVATPIIASALVPVAAAAASVCTPVQPGTTAGAACGANCQCLKTMTSAGPGSPACVDFTSLRGTFCGPHPGGFTGCASGDICVQVDSSTNLGLCYGPCRTPTCTC